MQLQSLPIKIVNTYIDPVIFIFFLITPIFVIWLVKIFLSFILLKIFQLNGQFPKVLLIQFVTSTFNWLIYFFFSFPDNLLLTTILSVLVNLASAIYLWLVIRFWLKLSGRVVLRTWAILMFTNLSWGWLTLH